MKTQITELTTEQKTQFTPWVKKWVEIGLRTGETDWETFETYIKVAYKKANIPFPNKIIRVQSPIVGAFASAIAGQILNSVAVGVAVRVAVHDAVDDAVGVAVHGAVDDAVGGAVHDAVGGAVHDAVDGAVGVAVRVAVGVAVHDAVHGAVDDAVGGAVHGAVGVAVRVAVRVAVDNAVKKLKIQWHYWFGGQFWVGGWWGSPSFASFFVDVCGLKLEKDILERYECYRKICESVNYIWCNKDFVMVCARPKHIDFNQRGQLHSERRKAIEYPDGYGLYFLNGIKVSEWLVITPAEQIDPKLALNEKNADVQREIIRKIGYERILKACNAKTLEEWTCPKTGLKYKVQEMKVGAINRRYLCYEHASMPGIYYAKCMPPEAKNIVQMRGYQTGVFGFDPLEARENLRKNNLVDEKLLAMLPETVQ